LYIVTCTDLMLTYVVYYVVYYVVAVACGITAGISQEAETGQGYF